MWAINLHGTEHLFLNKWMKSGRLGKKIALLNSQ